MLSLLMPHGDQNATRDDISTYGFLYGTFPTAPTVFVFASQYNLAMEIVSCGKTRVWDALVVEQVNTWTIYVHVNSFRETRQSKQLRPKTTPFFSREKK